MRIINRKMAALAVVCVLGGTALLSSVKVFADPAADPQTIFLQHIVPTDIVKSQHWDQTASLPAGVTQIEAVAAQNALVVTATPAGLAKVQEIIKTLDIEPRQVQINVDSLTTSLSNFAKESYQIAPGKEHDALLLAALLKDGAQEDQSPRITTTTDIHAGIKIETPIPMLPPLTFSCEATPHLNKDGSITVALSLKKDTLLPISSPGPAPIETSTFSATNTFTNGQTQLVQYMSGNNDPKSVTLYFAQAKLVDPVVVQSVDHP